MKQTDLPGISPGLFALFSRYGERYVARNFHAVRMSRAGRLDRGALQGIPLVIYLNHPSWWDPMICLLLANRLFPGRRHYGPIDGAALNKYRFFEKLGFFGIEAGTVQGARRFLEVGSRIVEQPDSVLWITAQGRFTDSRDRPVQLRPGLGHLVSRMGRMRKGAVLPLAVEYPFWGERYPEALVRFGEPLDVSKATLRPADWTRVLAECLESAQNELEAESITRDPARFEKVVSGGSGVGGVYDAWRRYRAWLRGEQFRPEHGLETEP